ncbi:MAG: hypothetical protein AAF570_13515, partial [Bacteroidota bacterium]
MFRDSLSGGHWIVDQNQPSRLIHFGPKGVRYLECGLPVDFKITCLDPEYPGKLWIGGNRGLLTVRYDPDDLAMLDVQWWVRDQIITSYFRDLQGTIWYGTHRGGLHLLPNSWIEFRAYPDSLQGIPQAMAVSPDGNHIYVGTDSALYVLPNFLSSAPSSAPQILFSGIDVRQLFRDRQQRLWVASRTRGWFVVPPFHSDSSLRFSVSQAAFSGKENVLEIRETHEGTVWMRTPTELIWHHGPAQGRLPITGPGMTSMQPGLGDTVWIACHRTSACFATRDTLCTIPMPFFQRMIFSKNSKFLWWSTAKEQPPRILRTSRSGDSIQDIYKDAYVRDLIDIAEDEWWALDRDRILCVRQAHESVPIVLSLRDNGIRQGLHFGQQPDSNGRILLFCTDGIRLLDPVRMATYSRIPTFQLRLSSGTGSETSMQTLFSHNWTGKWFSNARSVGSDSWLEVLAPFDLAVDIQTFHSRATPQFEYRLEASDTAWKVLRTHRIRQPRLDPGDYCVEVRRTDRRGPIVRLPLRVVRPFFQRWYGILVLVLAGGILLSSWMGWRNRQLRSIVQTRTQALRDANANLYHVNNELLFAKAQISDALGNKTAENNALLEALPDILLILDASGKVLEFRLGHLPPLAQHLKKTPHLQELLAPEAYSRWQWIIHSIAETGKKFERIFAFQFEMQGKIHDFDARIAKIDGQEAFLMLIRDVTERNQRLQAQQTFALRAQAAELAARQRERQEIARIV